MFGIKEILQKSFTNVDLVQLGEMKNLSEDDKN